ncbi:hypothetical protein LTR37_007019 [Vermiconidia calcicola]|uniref:Uncharacterized protein n=1 Tax=Vermiconidia calcicola TaxID=1690605 RepID=A0ACC3NF22_9PEZI|nr:hypothetical protein LTR37_007019 [Vermiconidia calcicola]
MAMAELDHDLAGHQVHSTTQVARSETDLMEEAESGSSRPSTGLLTVPREIRNAILKMVLIARLDLWVETYWSSQGKFGCNDYETRAYFQLSLVCHQLNDEAADIFFGENRFLFPLDMTRARIPNRHAGLIRRATSLGPPMTTKPRFWYGSKMEASNLG